MKVVICGGRWYHFTKDDFHLLATLHSQYGFTLVVTGGAIGADKDGELWAKLQGIPTLTFPPDWDRHGRSAGPIRNAAMLDFCGASGRNSHCLPRRKRHGGLREASEKGEG